MLQMLAGFDITQTKPIRKKQKKKDTLKLENYMQFVTKAPFVNAWVREDTLQKSTTSLAELLILYHSDLCG